MFNDVKINISICIKKIMNVDVANKMMYIVYTFEFLVLTKHLYRFTALISISRC